MTTRMHLQTRRRPATLAQLAGRWWIFVITGVAWLILIGALASHLWEGDTVKETAFALVAIAADIAVGALHA